MLLNCMLGEARRHVIFPSSTRHPHGIYTMLHCSFVTSAVECSALRLQVVLEFENRPPFKRLPRNCFDDSETVHLSRMFCLLVSLIFTRYKNLVKSCPNLFSACQPRIERAFAAAKRLTKCTAH